MSDPLASPASEPDLPPPMGSWNRVYALVVVFFVVEVVLFSWLTWSVS